MKKQIHMLRGALILIALLTINSTTFADFVIKGNAKVNVLAGTSLTSHVDVSMSESAVFTNNGTVTLKGNFTNNVAGVSDLGNGNFIMDGPAAQSVFGTGTSQIVDLDINNGNGVTFDGSVNISGTLVMESGIVTLGSGNLLLESTSTLSIGTSEAFGLTKMFVTNGTGELRKEFPATGSFIYPLGDQEGTDSYSPIELVVTAGDLLAGDYLGASVKGVIHPNNMSYNHYLARYWSISTNRTISSLDYNATGVYNDPEDIVGTESIINHGFFVSPEWFIYNPITPALDYLYFENLTEGGDITGVEFDYLAGLKIFLQGAYDDVNDNMRVSMTALIPLTAAEAYGHVGYSGPQAVAARVNIPPTAVDWVLIELRDATSASAASPSTVLETVAGFILQDGSIVAQDGISSLAFNYIIADNPYFVVRHRNHISAMSSADGLTKTNSTYIYNMSVAGSAFGAAGVVEVESGSGVYGLFAGETNTSNIITNADKQAVDDNIDELYHIADVNLSGIVSNEDKQFVDDNIDNWGKVPK